MHHYIQHGKPYIKYIFDIFLSQSRGWTYMKTEV